jgi:hypothetical protein
MKRWLLLWRGSHDRLTAQELHHGCDGDANTLLFILNTDENVFSGVTLVKSKSPALWEKYGHWKRDGNLRSFLFTLRNSLSVLPGQLLFVCFHDISFNSCSYFETFRLFASV